MASTHASNSASVAHPIDHAVSRLWLTAGTVCLAALLILGALLSAPGAAGAHTRYPVNGTCGADGSVTWRFSNDPQWTTARRNTVEAAFNEWEKVRSYGGQPTVDLQRVTTGGEIEVRWDAEPGPPGTPIGDGYAQCSGNFTGIELRDAPSVLDNAAYLRFTARHEMGHILGLGHVGRYDNLDSRIPTMATCTNYAERQAQTLEKDDEGAVLTRNMSGVPPLNANPGFEQGNERWTPGSGTGTVLMTVGSYQGARHLSVYLPNAYTSLLSQEINFNTPATWIASGLQFRKDYPGDTARVKLQTSARQVTYSSADHCARASQPYNQLNATYASDGPSSTTSWRRLDNDRIAYVSSIWQGADVRIIVSGNSQNSSGGRAWLRLDNVYARPST